MLFVLCICITLTLRGGTILAVQTASMVPVFAPGDALIVQSSPTTFTVGQIVSYRSRRDPRQIISHRVVALDEKQQQLITKGDNLPEPDPPIRNWDVLGTVHFIVPKAGYIFSFMYTWPGLICVIYIPALLILVLEVHRLHTNQDSNHYLRLLKNR